MKKWHIAGLIIAIVLIAGIVFADQMTFSTYYPAPFGVYREMRIMRAAIGETYHKAGDYPWNETGLGGPGEIDEWVDLLVEGHVGLGTTEPIANVDIYYPTGAIGLRVLGQTNALFRLQSDEPGGRFFDIEPDTDGAIFELDDIDIMALNYASQGVGIGTTDPGGKLGIYNAGAPGMTDSFYLTTHPGEGRSLAVHHAGVGNIMEAYSYSGTWGSGSWNRVFTIKPDGSVGIGTEDPEHTLDINGGLKIKHSDSTVLTLVPNADNMITHNLGTKSWLIFAINGHHDANPFRVKGVNYINENSFSVRVEGGAAGGARINWFILEGPI